MNDILRSVDEPDADLDSIALLCWSMGSWDAAKITTVVAIRSDLVFFWPAEWLDDAEIVSAVQSFLQSKRTRVPVAPSQQRAWDHFYRQYHPLVRRTVATSCRRESPVAEPDDLSQEVWGEILVQLPKLAYDSARAGLSSWMAGLTRSLAECSVAVESLAEFLRSRDLGPEDVCFMGEVWAQLEAALAKLRERTSAKTYEVFWRRFFWRQSVKEIAAALDLSSHEVRCRYHRVRRKWQELTKGLAVLGHNIDVPTHPNSPPPRKPR
jgi:DNA-directed RNA polymerase specialized sigma24 family protein